MQKERIYISCTDKRIVITFTVSIIISILTTTLLCNGGLLPLIPANLQLVGWIFVLTLFYCGWIISLSLLGVLLIGIVDKILSNKNAKKDNTAT